MNRAALIVAMVILAIIFLPLAGFTYLCIGWPGPMKSIHFALLFGCVTVITLFILCIVGLTKVSKRERAQGDDILEI